MNMTHPLLLLTLIAVSAQAADRGFGFPQPGAAATLRNDFQTPPPGYGEVPFWWWTGDKLDKARLLEQIEALHRAGISGAQINYSHMRSEGWRTADVEPPIFSDEWWDIVAFTAVECAKRKMGIGLSGYTIDWPGNNNLFRKLGISTPETRANGLTLHTFDTQGGPLSGRARQGDIAVIAAPLADGKPQPDRARTLDPKADAWSLPEGNWRIYQVATAKLDGTYDPMDPQAGQRVIERFFNPFLERIPKEAHGALNYFFQDELRLGGDLRIWCADFPEAFRTQKGYDILPYLPALFGDYGPDTPKIRLDFNDVMVSLTEERYFKPIFNWHNTRGMIYACDPASRGKNPMEFGDYMRSMRWYTAPGFDTPGRSADLIKNKVGSSIAHLYRRPRVWLEGYHSQGWQASTATIFDSTAHNFLYGSTLLNLHGLYYSTYGGWWEWAPPCYHFRRPYWAYLPHYLKYFERLSYLLSQGVHVADIAVLNPLEPVVEDRGRGGRSVGVAHRLVTRLVNTFQTDVDFIDTESIGRGDVSDGRCHVAGEAYRMLILPGMFAIRTETLQKLIAFKRAGGLVAVVGEPPRHTDTFDSDRARADALIAALLADGTPCLPDDPSDEALKALTDSITPPDFRAPAGAKALHRRIGFYDIYYICDLAASGACTFRAKGQPERWNPWDGSQRTLLRYTPNDDGTTTVDLEGNGSPQLIVFAPVQPSPLRLVTCTLAGDLAVERSSDRLTVAGIAEKPGPQQAKGFLNGRPVTLSGTAPAPLPSVALEGEWAFTLKPTMNNAWGDYRLPATNRMIGAELRHLRMPDTLPLGERMTASFGPQFRAYGPFPSGSDLAALQKQLAEMSPDALTPDRTKPAAWWPFCFSWREGTENHPAYQDWHHGLNRRVGDDVFVLGPYNRGMYDVVPPANQKPQIHLFQTAVFAPVACTAKPVVHGVAPQSIWIDGALRKPDEPIALTAGYHMLVVRYEAFGRAALVLMRTDLPSDPSTLPLSMRWYRDPAVLPFDCFGGTVPSATYSATLPPACTVIGMRMRGTIASAAVDGQPATVTLLQTDRHGERHYRITPIPAVTSTATLTLTVKHEPGYSGGAVLCEPAELTCGTGTLQTGNWAKLADGLTCYSGGAVYEKRFTLTVEQLSQRCTLDLGNVGVCCGISVNGGPETVLTAPPWKAVINESAKPGENTLTVTVYNTLNNHYQTIPTRYRQSVDQAPSGLLGPVTLTFAPRVILTPE